MPKARVKFKLFYTVLSLLYVPTTFGTTGNPENVSIWGPGLEAHHIIMPARYFFVDVPDYKVQSDNFEVVIQGETALKKPCRIWSNILDRKNGSFIVRYKVYETCSNIKISVKLGNKHVAKSPYVIDQIVYSDDCFCPKKDIPEILKTWHCEAIPPQITKNLKEFQTIDWDIERPKVIKQFNQPTSVSLCHYVIKNNEIYRKCYGKYVGFNMFSDAILLSVARKAKLPDLEFFVNLGDWPLSTKNLKEKYPILSWCGSTDSYDIIMPTYELTESALENMGRVMLDMLSVQGNVENIWDKRESKLFWRGRDSNRHRLELINLSRKYPELINASLTNFFFYRDEEIVYGPKSEHISFFKFFDYKYQLAIDGTVAPYRTPFLLVGGSLVFKPHSKYFEYFYEQLEPHIHYVPVKTDLSDLKEKIIWAKDHDQEAKIIAQNGQNFANNHLLPEHVFCYYFHVLNELGKVIKSEVRVLEDMELVSQKKNVCNCLEDNIKQEL
ncbi:hypothetical protein ABEB36_013178 [Hypothenemus hampei]